MYTVRDKPHRLSPSGIPTPHPKKSLGTRQYHYKPVQNYRGQCPVCIAGSSMVARFKEGGLRVWSFPMVFKHGILVQSDYQIAVQAGHPRPCTGSLHCTLYYGQENYMLCDHHAWHLLFRSATLKTLYQLTCTFSQGCGHEKRCYGNHFYMLKI